MFNLKKYLIKYYIYNSKQIYFINILIYFINQFE